MEQLYLIREGLREFYSRFEGYIRSVLKFILCLIVLISINSKIGYMSRLDNFALILIIALLCSFLPANLIVFFAAIFVALNSYALSIECAVVVAAIFFLMFLLYYRYSPKDTLAVLITPICFFLKMPYLMPLIFGVIGTPLSAVSVSCGVISYYLIEYVNSSYETISGMADANTVEKFKYIVDGLMHNKEMMVMVIAFSVTVIAVNLIKRLPIDHSWTIALAFGAVLDIFVVIIAGSGAGIKINTGALIAGSLLSVLIAFIIKFFVFAVDYTKTERVQFEDDEYYYYVKAVPKITKKTLGKEDHRKDRWNS